MKHRHRVLLIVVVFACVAGLFPFKDTVVPAWKLQVVDTAANPVPNTRIRQVWRNYSTEQHDHEEDSVTDEAGYAAFPERTERACALLRVIVGLNNASAVAHASWGPHAFVLVLAGRDYQSDLCVFDGKGQPPSRVILRRRSEIGPSKDSEPALK
jgi:hypothetical protein